MMVVSVKPGVDFFMAGFVSTVGSKRLGFDQRQLLVTLSAWNPGSRRDGTEAVVEEGRIT